MTRVAARSITFTRERWAGHSGLFASPPPAVRIALGTTRPLAYGAPFITLRGANSFVIAS